MPWTKEQKSALKIDVSRDNKAISDSMKLSLAFTNSRSLYKAREKKHTNPYYTGIVEGKYSLKSS